MSKPDSNTTGWIDILKFVIACAAIVAFGSFVYYMLGQTKAEEKEWTRAVYLFQGVEAVAFAAAGFMFGKEVHRERAEKPRNELSKRKKALPKGKRLPRSSSPKRRHIQLGLRHTPPLHSLPRKQ